MGRSKDRALRLNPRKTRRRSLGCFLWGLSQRLHRNSSGRAMRRPPRIDWSSSPNRALLCSRLKRGTRLSCSRRTIPHGRLSRLGKFSLSPGALPETPVIRCACASILPKVPSDTRTSFPARPPNTRSRTGSSRQKPGTLPRAPGFGAKGLRCLLKLIGDLSRSSPLDTCSCRCNRSERSSSPSRRHRQQPSHPSARTRPDSIGGRSSPRNT